MIRIPDDVARVPVSDVLRILDAQEGATVEIAYVIAHLSGDSGLLARLNAEGITPAKALAGIAKRVGGPA